jgi:hypothetical protein
MKRFALFAAAGAAALAATLAVAQPQPIPPAGGPGSQERTQSREERRGEWRERRAERMQERLDERLSRLRSDLNLRPEQVPLFDAVEAAIKKNAQERRERWASMGDRRDSFRDADLMEKLDMMATRQGERAARLKSMADATKPLWETLSDAQKTVARRAVRMAMRDGHERMMRMRDRWEERRGDDRDHGPRHHRRDRDDDRGPVVSLARCSTRDDIAPSGRSGPVVFS